MRKATRSPLQRGDNIHAKTKRDVPSYDPIIKGERRTEGTKQRRIRQGAGSKGTGALVIEPALKIPQS